MTTFTSDNNIKQSRINKKNAHNVEGAFLCISINDKFTNMFYNQ